MNSSKKTILEVAVVAGLAIALSIIAIIIISLFGGNKSKGKEQPLLCAEPLYPEVIQAEQDGEYVRKLSTYWWVHDVKNGKVIIEDVNRFKGDSKASKDMGVADFRGNIIIPAENTDVSFTANGYIKAYNGSYSFFNMGGNCLDTFEGDIPQEALAEYVGEQDNAERPYVPIAESIDGKVQYFGKYMTVSQYEVLDSKKKMNTCVYEFKAKKE